jgi:hypothetical protein
VCEFCTDPISARESAQANADLLERLAKQYRAMANGDIKPHSANAEAVAVTARIAMRELARDQGFSTCF